MSKNVYEECCRITALMKEREGFTFLRLGDGEAEFLLRHQEGEGRREPKCRDEISIDSPVSIEDYAPTREYALMLKRSYELADYVDFHDLSNNNSSRVQKIELARSSSALRNPGGEVSSLFRPWVKTQLYSYLEEHRVLFCAPEAPLLQSLRNSSDFLELSGEYFPAES